MPRRIHDTSKPGPGDHSQDIPGVVASAFLNLKPLPYTRGRSLQYGLEFYVPKAWHDHQFHEGAYVGHYLCEKGVPVLAIAPRLTQSDCTDVTGKLMLRRPGLAIVRLKHSEIITKFILEDCQWDGDGLIPAMGLLRHPSIIQVVGPTDRTIALAQTIMERQEKDQTCRE